MSEKKHLVEVNELDDKKKKSLANRLIVAAVLIVVLVPCIFLGGWFWFGGLLAALLCAIYEILHASNKKYNLFIKIFTYVLVLSYVYWFLIKFNVQQYLRLDALGQGSDWHFSLEDYFSTLSVSVFSLALSLGVYCLVAIVSKDFSWSDVTYLFTMTFLVGIGFQSLMFIRYVPFAEVASGNWGSLDATTPVFKYWQSAIFFVFIIFTAIMNDTWAYFVGILFGKHKMSPRVSPNKTWEGFFGGWILGGLSGLGFLMIVDACGFQMLPSFAIFGANSQWWWAVILSFLLPLVGDLGDFSFSMIKRHYGIKDYSKVLGAHGGILDRADSLTFCALFASIFVVFVNGGWNFFA